MSMASSWPSGDDLMDAPPPRCTPAAPAPSGGSGPSGPPGSFIYRHIIHKNDPQGKLDFIVMVRPLPDHPGRWRRRQQHGEGSHHPHPQNASNIDICIIHKNDPQTKPDFIVVVRPLPDHPRRWRRRQHHGEGSHHPHQQNASNVDILYIKMIRKPSRTS